MQENLSFLSTRHRLPNIRTRRWHRLAAGELVKALNFHRSIPGYAPTPLYTLPALAQNWA